MRLREALKIQRGDVVAFVGAGGKTSALFRLADELRAEGWRVLATTTTRIAAAELKRAPQAIQVAERLSAPQVRQQLNESSFVFLYTSLNVSRQKVIGLARDSVGRVLDSVDSDVLLIEADGARGLPLKAPYDHEPVIPPDTSLVVPVAGLDALGQPLDETHVYNAARIRGRYGFPEGGIIVPPWMAVILRDEQLGLRSVPDKARVTVLLNKATTRPHEMRRARRVAQIALREPRIDAVAIGAMQAAGDPVFETQRRVGAVVLAAGTSSRMGQSKVLLPWDRRTVIEAVVARLAPLRLAEIIVVTGYQADEVARVLAPLPVRVVHNPDYERGEMLSSLQVGLRTLGRTVSACLVVLGDQPMIDGRNVDRVLAAYAERRGEIVVPVFRNERGHPVLFDQRYWQELLALTDGAPRDVVRRYPDQVAVVEVHNDSILRDIDTPEQYRRERYLAGLS